MDCSTVKKELIKAMEEFEVIDCHEHMLPEKNRLETAVDVFTFFTHYTHNDLIVSGMSESEYQSLYNHNIPLERRWEIFEPYWERIRWTSYSRAVLLAIQRFYGFEDLNRNTYEGISIAIQNNNNAGLYERVLKDACKIRIAINQCGMTDLGSPLLIPVMPLMYEMYTWEALSHPPFEPNATIQSLDDYLDAVRRYILRVKSEGVVGLKMRSNPFGHPDRAEAIRAFDSLRSGSVSTLPEFNPLRDYVVDETIKFAAKEGLVICVHTGYWGDFRKLHPLHMIPLIQRHPNAKFDIYHLGYPWVRDALMLGKGFPNVWLNLCWTHIISQKFAIDGMDEAIDLIPANKILAFGGDYRIPVEKIYGHLVMAREDMAEVLAKRIVEGRMTESQALDLAKKWFWDNAIELYGLKL